MPWWKQLLVEAYYRATLPYRWWEARHNTITGMAPIVVLFYHRVADDVSNDWTCPNRTFARQMCWLRERFDMISLAEAQARLRSGHNIMPAVSITFDDGYAANCEHALPLLVDMGIPCTYFVSTRFVLEGSPFPHDVAQGTPFAPNTPQQLRTLADAGIEIGAHTRSHADLGLVTDPRVLHDEVVVPGLVLEEMINHPVRYFAFPYGLHRHLNRAAFEIAREAGYEGVCSAYGGYNVPGDDAFHLQRVHGDVQMARFKNSVTIDPRKRRTPRFEYHHQPAPLELVEVS
ncbi:MAG TPA: polysaccharide deacetylase family protein [Pirellulales bacterium]|jgi:peptidoglycan/xylan/chitin deacetylase (PgdA/CDA1 family)|nr:polysaccharide deacetylase family protein [Pirellulales bacterium]